MSIVSFASSVKNDREPWWLATRISLFTVFLKLGTIFSLSALQKMLKKE